MGFLGSKRNWLALMTASILTTTSYAAPYQIIDLGTLGGVKNFAFSLNDINEVVGISDGRVLEEDEITEENPGTFCNDGNAINVREYCNHAYLFRDNMIFDLGEFDQDGTNAYGINNNSIIVGHGFITLDDGDPDTDNDPVTEQAFVSIDGGEIQALPFPPESANLADLVNPIMRAQHITDTNDITGYALVGIPVPDEDDVFVTTTRPYIYNLDTDTFQIIPPYEEDDLDFSGTGRSINSSGQLVGWGSITLENAGTTTQALLWDPTTPELSQTLGTLGGFSSQAYDINDSGYIVGISDTDENFFRNEELAFVYDIATGTMTRLPEFSTVSNFTRSIAYAINNANQVVGSAQSSISSSNSAAFLYTVGDQELINLNTMIPCNSGWYLTLARDINESGVIIGTGTFEGEVRSFMLVPTADTTPPNCNGTDQGSEGSSSSSSTGFLFLPLALTLFIRRRITSNRDR